MTKKPNKDRVVSFRLTEEQFAPFEEIMKKTGTKPSYFFRELVINKTPVFKASSQGLDRMVFLSNKVSNNLNQLAHQVNQANRRGILSEVIYLKWLNNLTRLGDLMLIGIDHANQG